MANTYNGMVLANIAQEGFSAFSTVLAPLGAFSTDFSSEIVDGETVTTRIVPEAGAAEDLVTDLTNDYSAASQDVTTTAKTVTLNQHPLSSFHLTDTEAQNIGAGVWSDTARRLVRTKARSVAKACLDYAYNLITNAAYSTAGFVGAASTFDADAVADLGQTCVDAGWDPNDPDWSMVLKPSYYTALKKDPALRDYSASLSNVLSTGVLPRIDNFKIHQSPTLPPAMAVAMRPVAAQDESAYLAYEVMQDPISGVVMTYSAVYLKETLRKVQHVFEVRFGATVAVAAALKRMTSQ